MLPSSPTCVVLSRSHDLEEEEEIHAVYCDGGPGVQVHLYR